MKPKQLFTFYNDSEIQKRELAKRKYTMNLTDGKRIHLARIGKGWTLKDLSNRTGLSIYYLSKIENDKRPIPLILEELLLDQGADEWYSHVVNAIHDWDHPELIAEQLVHAFHNAIGFKDKSS